MPAGRKPEYYFYPNNIFGLFVGVNKFPFGGGIRSLDGCVNDATGMYEVFKNRGECVLLTDELANRITIFNTFTNLLSKAQSGDLFIFQVSTHGVEQYDDFYFLPYDSHGGNIIGTGVPSISIISALSPKAKEGVKIILILDACDSGAVSFNIAKYRGANQGGLACIFGCSPKEKAMEMTFNAKTHGALVYGMLKALKGEVEEIRKKGYVNLRDAFDYTYQFITKELKNSDQHPVLIGTLDGNTILKEF